MTSQSPLTRLDVISLCACVITVVELLLCPVILMSVQCFFIYFRDFSGLHVKLPPLTEWYQQQHLLFFLIIPAIFLVVTIAMLAFPIHSVIRLVYAIIVTTGFLLLLCAGFLSVFWPALELSRQLS